jgi:hypothetical protein
VSCDPRSVVVEGVRGSILSWLDPSVMQGARGEHGSNRSGTVGERQSRRLGLGIRWGEEAQGAARQESDLIARRLFLLLGEW